MFFRAEMFLQCSSAKVGHEIHRMNCCFWKTEGKKGKKLLGFTVDSLVPVIRFVGLIRHALVEISVPSVVVVVV